MSARVSHILHPVPDLADGVAFYRDVLGFTVRFQDGDRFASLDGGGTTVALISGAEDVTAGEAALGIRVDDVRAALADAVAAGSTSVFPPAEGPHEVRAVLRTPDGHLLVLHASR